MSYVVYAILLVLVFWGIKIAPKSSFHTDFMSLEITKGLQGIAAIAIVLHHISQTSAFRQSGELKFLTDIGVFLVGIFFFCSGYGLIKSMLTKPDYLKTFFKKRLPAVLIPFYTMTAAFAIYFLLIKVPMPTAQWILSITGLILFNSHAWYIVVITLMYVAFYFIFSRVQSQKKAFTLMGIFVAVQIVFGICWGHLPWWTGKPYWWNDPANWDTIEWWMQPCLLWFQGEWWVNATSAFFTGMLFAKFEKPVIAWLQKKYVIKLAIALVIAVASMAFALYAVEEISYWTEFGSNGTLGLGAKFICLGAHIVSINAFIVFLFMCMMKIRSINPASKFLGKISLELYLMHNLFLMFFAPILEKKLATGDSALEKFLANQWSFALFVIVGGIEFGRLFNYINHTFIKKLTSNHS